MGEKIRDLQPIHIGAAELMIELNEGYTKNEGRLIHIQNKHFRYLLKEKHFVKMAGAVLRSRREMEYIKSDESLSKIPRVRTDCAEADAQEKAIQKKLAEELAGQGIRYRIVSDGAKFVTVLVHQEDRKKLLQCFADRKVPEIDHPYTEKAGYTYLYQMHPFRLFAYDGLYVEIYFELPCMSLTKQTWIPLDRSIQRHIWEREEKDGDGCAVLDPASKIIFLCGWSVFTTHCFSDRSRQYIAAHHDVLRDAEFAGLMRTVFFGFTDRMTEMLLQGDFDGILAAYYKFDQY